MDVRRLACIWVMACATLLVGALSSVHAASAEMSPQTKIGVLILAHGGSAQWNHLVEEAVADAKLPYPTEIAFGMAMHPEEVRAIQRRVNVLEARHVQRIVVIPLLISSASEVMRQFTYVLGLCEHGPWEAHIKPVTHRVSMLMTGPLDDDPVVAAVLLDRAKELSRTPDEESVVLIAHGPNEETDNARWLETMQRIARRVEAMGHFRTVVPVTMRDDAPAPIRDAATQQMRAIVSAQSAKGRTLVVPLLLASGGVEAKIPSRLHGLTYSFRGQGLLPHPKLSQWIAHQVDASAQRAGSLLPSDEQRPIRVL